jgi:hypothetical protein
MGILRIQVRERLEDGREVPQAHFGGGLRRDQFRHRLAALQQDAPFSLEAHASKDV